MYFTSFSALVIYDRCRSRQLWCCDSFQKINIHDGQYSVGETVIVMLEQEEEVAEIRSIFQHTGNDSRRYESPLSFVIEDARR